MPLPPGLLGRLRLRMLALDAIRAWLRREHFLEVETPYVVPNPGMDVHLEAFDVRDRRGRLAGRLITSPELHMKRLVAGGVARCAQVARCWRADELGTRHQPEFTMLEWYRAHEGLDAMLRDTEAIVRAAAGVSEHPDAIMVAGRCVSLREPFAVTTMRACFQRYCPDLGDPVALATRDEETYYEAISTRIEPHLGWDVPVFVTGFPACHASLARRDPDDASVCLRAELYIAGVELCNAFDELTDPVEQRARFEEDQRERARRGLPIYPIDEEFLAALDEGLPPCAGNALGLDRLIALTMGTTEIARGMAFPQRPR